MLQQLLVSFSCCFQSPLLLVPKKMSINFLCQINLGILFQFNLFLFCHSVVLLYSTYLFFISFTLSLIIILCNPLLVELKILVLRLMSYVLCLLSYILFLMSFVLYLLSYVLRLTFYECTTQMKSISFTFQPVST